jgi:aspartate aminotransferase
MRTFSNRVGRIKISPAAALRRQARELRDAGRDVLVLSSGDLDFATPEHVVTAAYQAILRGETKYTNVDGTPEAKDAVRHKFRQQNGLDFTREEVIVCNGSTQALSNSLFALVGPGDEVIIPTPCWPTYIDQVELAEGAPVKVAGDARDGFKLTAEKLARAITGRTRCLIIDNPVNPTGAVYSREELAAIASVLLGHPNVWVLTDDLYEHVLFDNVTFATIAQVEPRLADRTVTINGVAKAYAMMGWRIGFAGGPADVIREMTKVQSQNTAGASSVAQAAAVAALTGPQQLVRERAAILAGNRGLIVDLINGCPGLSCARPQGTFYLMVSCAAVMGRKKPDGGVIASDRDFAAFLLDAANVVVVPGGDLYLSPYVRLSFARSSEFLTEAARRIKQACSNLK